MPPRVVDQLARGAARRRAVDVLQLGAIMCTYSAGQVADGLSPAEAARAVIEAAVELENVAASLRRLARPGYLDTAGRRALIAELAEAGWSHRRIAEAVGTHKRSVWNDLHARA